MEATSFRLDTMHSGLRLLVLLTTLLGFGLGTFLIIPVIISASGLTELPVLLVSVIGGIVLGGGLGWGVERLLQSIWPSGRWLRIESESLTLQEPGNKFVKIRWDNPITVLPWYHMIQQGRGFIPKGWYCTAVRLTQEENRITVYAFSKPAEARTMPQWPVFWALATPKQIQKSNDESKLIQVSQHAQLREAEIERWNNGAEMSSVDFAAFVAELDKRLSYWPKVK